MKMRVLSMKTRSR